MAILQLIAEKEKSLCFDFLEEKNQGRESQTD